MPAGPLFLYRDCVASGELAPDTDQELAAEKLQSLHRALTGYRPTNGAVGWRERLGLARRPLAPPQGLYLYGGVGRGKSMLMDLFFTTAPVARKRRVHFHAFMLEVHERLQSLRMRGVDNVLPSLARDLAQEAWLLCFDEFHVADIADAMILGRLFAGLFDAGAVVVATSNWAPDDLYKDGLQRSLFLPFLDILKARLDVLALCGPLDYRFVPLVGDAFYHWPLGETANRAMDSVFAALSQGIEPQMVSLDVRGRTLTVAHAVGRTGCLSFAEVCGRPLGAADYIALARRFDTFLVEDIPELTETMRNEAKRFMTLVDEFYEHRSRLVISADAPAERLYTGTTHAAEFRRTVSRLMEMRSQKYSDPMGLSG